MRRRLCVDHNRLFDPVIRKARSLVDSGALGEIVSVEAHQGVNLVEEAGAAGGAKHWSVRGPFAPLYNLGPIRSISSTTSWARSTTSRCAAGPRGQATS